MRSFFIAIFKNILLFSLAFPGVFKRAVMILQRLIFHLLGISGVA